CARPRAAGRFSHLPGFLAVRPIPRSPENALPDPRVSRDRGERILRPNNAPGDEPGPDGAADSVGSLTAGHPPFVAAPRTRRSLSTSHPRSPEAGVSSAPYIHRSRLHDRRTPEPARR